MDFLLIHKKELQYTRITGRKSASISPIRILKEKK